MREYNFKINGNDYNVTIDNIDDTTAEVTVNGAHFNVEFDGVAKPKTNKLVQVEPMPGAAAAARPEVAKPAVEAAPASSVKSPLPGVIIDIFVKPGDTVKAGQRIFVLEAMKMENNIDSDREGVVKSVNVSKGDSVLEGDLLITIE